MGSADLWSLERTDCSTKYNSICRWTPPNNLSNNKKLIHNKNKSGRKGTKAPSRKKVYSQVSRLHSLTSYLSIEETRSGFPRKISPNESGMNEYFSLKFLLPILWQFQWTVTSCSRTLMPILYHFSLRTLTGNSNDSRGLWRPGFLSNSKVKTSGVILTPKVITLR